MALNSWDESKIIDLTLSSDDLAILNTCLNEVLNGFLVPNFEQAIGASLRLRQLPGIGAWTAEYVALRAFGDQDAFPATDYGLKQELASNPTFSTNGVRPFRAYAPVYMWKEFLKQKEAVNATGL